MRSFGAIYLGGEVVNLFFGDINEEKKESVWGKLVGW